MAGPISLSGETAMPDPCTSWFFTSLPTLILVGVTIFYVIFTHRIANTMREQADIMRAESRKTANSRVHELLWRLLERYGSAEMLLAVASLWHFHDDMKKKGGDLAKEYEIIYRNDFDIIEGRPRSEQAAFATGTLHYRRRIVKHFYQFLASLHELEPTSDHLIYSHWSERNLRIIPEILIPIEETLALNLDTYSPDFQISINRLRKLYEDSKKRLPSSTGTAAS
jgi:hypothetical protein